MVKCNFDYLLNFILINVNCNMDEGHGNKHKEGSNELASNELSFSDQIYSSILG